MDAETLQRAVPEVDYDRFVRQIRDTIEQRLPVRREPDPAATTGAFLIGLGLGMAAMYLLDPGEGARRRALVADQLGRVGRVAGQTAEGRVRDIRNRAEGAAAEAGGGQDTAQAATHAPSGGTTDGDVDMSAGPEGELP